MKLSQLIWKLTQEYNLRGDADVQVVVRHEDLSSHELPILDIKRASCIEIQAREE